MSSYALQFFFKSDILYKTVKTKIVFIPSSGHILAKPLMWVSDSFYLVLEPDLGLVIAMVNLSEPKASAQIPVCV